MAELETVPVLPFPPPRAAPPLAGWVRQSPHSPARSPGLGLGVQREAAA